MTIKDETKGVYFPRPPFSGPPPTRGGPEGPSHAGPVAALGPDPRSGVGKERARLMREHPEAWR